MILSTTGIIRRIDELGRIVIPKEIRKNLRIKNGDNLEILVDGENIILKKYSHIDNLESIASMYAESFYQVLKYNVIITDTDKIVAVGGNLKKKYVNNGISEEIERMMERRDNFVERKKKNIEISPGMSEFGYYTVATIINNGDSIGSVIILSLDTPGNIVSYVLARDVKALSKASGIGKKTAETIIVTLHDKFEKLAFFFGGEDDYQIVEDVYGSASDAVEALVELGFDITKATKAVNAVNTGDMSSEEILFAALSVING